MQKLLTGKIPEKGQCIIRCRQIKVHKISVCVQSGHLGFLGKDCVCPAEPVKGAEIVHSGPAELYEGDVLELHCRLSSGNYQSYLWLLNGRPISPSYDRHIEDAYLRIKK